MGRSSAFPNRALKIARVAILIFCLPCLAPLGVEADEATVIPEGNFLYAIPHTASGGGFLTRLFISNLANDANALSINRIDQSGMVVESSTTTLEPAGTLMIADREAQRSQELTIHWFVISSEHPIAASVLFDFDSAALNAEENFRTAVGALATGPLTVFTLPVRVATVEVTVGLALANLNGNSNQITLVLHDSGGAAVALDTLTLAPFAQAAFSLQEREAFRDAVLGAEEFVGSLAVITTEPTEPVAALVVGNNLRQLFSLPVSSGVATETLVSDNPLPTVTGLLPFSATTGGSGFTLKVTGTDFVPGSTVRWNGSERATSFISNTQLRATISSSDLATAGVAQVTVFSPTPGGGPSNALTFRIDNPVPTLASLSPSSHIAGMGNFTLIVSGSGFVPESVVRWNAINRTTTFVDGTHVTATIPANEIAVPGTAAVNVVNPTPGGGVSNALDFTIVPQGTPNSLDLGLFEVDNGPQVGETQEETDGAHLSLNKDDDDADGEKDNSNATIDGVEDQRDMIRLQLDVQPWDTISGTIRFSTDNPNLIRVFNEQDEPVTLPETMEAARFNSGPLNYHVEGVLPGSVTFTFTLLEEPVTLEDVVKVMVGREIGIQLIFYDGPVSDLPLADNLTQKVLDALAQNEVQDSIKAAFFIQTHVSYRGGNSVGQAMIAAESEAGHLVEIHTGSDEDHAPHGDRAEQPPYDINGDGQPDGQNGLESDLLRAKARIEELTGRTPLRVTPPEAVINQAVLDTYARVDLMLQLWDVSSGDTVPCLSDLPCIRNRLRTGIQNFIDDGNQSVIVTFHDIKEATANNLEEFLRVIENTIQHRGRNVRFEVLD